MIRLLAEVLSHRFAVDFVCRMAIAISVSILFIGLSVTHLFAAEEEAVARQELLSRHIPRYRRLREMLTTIDQLQTSGRSTEALKTVQWILDQPFDTLTRTDGELRSVKRLAVAKLKLFPEEWRNQYERVFGGEARRLLDDAKERQESHLAVEVLRRFPSSRVADEAALWLALRWRDQGEPGLATAVAIFEGAEPLPFSELSTPRLRVAYLAAKMAGNLSVAPDVLRELQTREDFQVDQFSSVVVSTSPVFPTRLFTGERLTAQLGEDHPGRRLSRDDIPVLHPHWQAEFLDRTHSPNLSTVVDLWRGQLEEANLTPIVPNMPLVVRGQLILRDYEGIRSCDLISGRLLWKFQDDTSLAAWVDGVAGNQRSGNVASGAYLPETLQWRFGSNSLWGYLSSDGIRCYAVDSLPSPAVQQSGRQDPFQARLEEPSRGDESNRLFALELPAANADRTFATPKLAWTVGRSPQGAKQSQDERYFLGPPIPSAGRLLCLAETDREIRLVALLPETGATLWEQPLAAADRAAVYDGERALMACQPIVSHGLILCPTQVGVLAAVDAVTGNMRWSYFDHDLPPEPARRPRGTVTARGRSGFASSTMVHGARILHLPVTSSALHCLELESGQLIWTQPRGRACAIAQVTDELVVLLEERGCRALKLADGSEVWNQPLNAVTGTGLDLGTEYLVPLEQGRFALLNTATGTMNSWQPPRSQVALGNLVACGERVLSVNPFGVTVFPQADWTRRKLKEESPSLKPAERLLLAANLKLAEGNIAQAEHFLDAALQESLPDERRQELKLIMREMLYHQLTIQQNSPAPLFDRLNRLAETPTEQGRLLARQGRTAISTGDFANLKTVLFKLSRLPVDITFESPDEVGWRYSAAACCRQMLAEVEPDVPDFVAGFRRELADQFAQRTGATPRFNDWRFLLRVNGDDESTAPVRSVLARRLEQAGDWHAAELLWLQNRRADSPQIAAEALAGCFRLTARTGWDRDAALALQELSGRFRNVLVEPGVTGQQFVDRLPSSSAARQWQRRLSASAHRVTAALIHSLPDEELAARDYLLRKPDRSQPDERSPGRYGEITRGLSLSEPLSADLLMRAETNQAKLVVVDQSTSQPVQEWSLPLRHSHPWPNSNLRQGHFFSIGVPGELRGYSLLHLGDDAPKWTQRPAPLNGRRAFPTIGPGGPSFVTFQVQHLLFVCDPWDGAVLWQRDKLEPQSGLYADLRTGIAGDERCLIVFGSDRLSYAMYDTMTGRLLREGRWELEPRHSRWAFGRKLFSVSQSRGQWLVRAWDPWENRWDLEDTMGDRNTAVQCMGSSEMAWLTPEGEFRLYDVALSQRTLNVRFEPEELEGFNSLRVFTKGDYCYVNLWRNLQAAQTRDHNYPLQDTLSPWIPHLRDDVYAIDRRDGKILWKRTMPNRTLLDVDPPGLPFLVLASLIRDAHDGNQRSLLVEVIDAATGELLGRNDHLPVDRIVNVEYNGADASLRVVGQYTSVQIRLLTEQVSAASNTPIPQGR